MLWYTNLLNSNNKNTVKEKPKLKFQLKKKKELQYKKKKIITKNLRKKIKQK